ncbi:MAG: TatD family hydrolase [Bacteroidetes bacterium]|nr:TatD family hydrolase [Bacteroidota bacterium]MBS1739241.1 TatD family hydrolase [Bacteroidota bacterium]MBS1775540.1 TatD family hydrolase [Bacteroidota bacterium]
MQNAQPPFVELSSSGWYSLGIHPWQVSADTLTDQMNDLKKSAFDKKVLAIGECGLDRVCNTEWSLQLKAFQMQIALSNEVKKPLIIHAVRAHQDVLQWLRKYHHQQPVIFHGVNHKGIETLWQAGQFVSFGKALFLENSPAQKAFCHIPEDSYFLETDDADISIESVYLMAAKLRCQSLEQIKNTIEKNFFSIFTL